MMIKELKLTGRKKLLGAVIISALMITGLTMWYTRPAAEAAILTPYDFYDDFTNDLSHWLTVGGVWGIQDGNLTCETDRFGQRLMIKEMTLYNFTAEYEIEFSTATYYEVGLLFRGIDGNELKNCYWAGIKSWGLVLHERKAGATYTLGAYSFTPALNTEYRIKVEATGQTLKIWLNEMLRVEASNSDFVSGTIGIMAWSASSEHALLDYVKISDASPSSFAGTEHTYSVSLRAHVTRIIMTCTWSGLGNITIKLVSRTVTYEESAMDIYEKTSVSFNGTDMTSLNVKRAQLVIPQLGSSEIWTLYLNMSSTMAYKVNVEVS